MIHITDANRQAVFSGTHAAFKAHETSLQTFLDAYDGEGGFLDGSYLDPYPRELSGEFLQRKKAARYHNYVETLVDLYVRKIYAKPVERVSKDAGLTAFWSDVTGAGVPMDAFMAEALSKALASGYVGVLADKTRDIPAGPSRAEETGRVYLAQYLPTTIQDWRITPRMELIGVKLREAIEAGEITEDVDPKNAYRMLLWDKDEWARVERGEDGRIEQGQHGLGLVPFVFLSPKRSKRWPLLGKSLIGNANVIRALFNRASEEDEVLRDQAFSVLVVNVPTDGDTQKVKDELGSEIGTTRALVVKGTATYETPDMNVPEAIRKNQAYLVQEIYRMAHMRFTRDSLEAEAADAIRLKHDELNDTLASIADACAEVERRIARFYFGWDSATPEIAEQRYQAADVTINYGREFFLGELEADLKAWVLALKEDLGETMRGRIKKRMAHRLEPHLSEEDRKKVEGEIDAVAKQKPEPQVLPGQALREGAVARLAKFGQPKEAA